MILWLPTWHLLDPSPWPNIFFLGAEFHEWGFPMTLWLRTRHSLGLSPWSNIFLGCRVPWYNFFFFYTNHTNHNTVQNFHSFPLQHSPISNKTLFILNDETLLIWKISNRQSWGNVIADPTAKQFSLSKDLKETE